MGEGAQASCEPSRINFQEAIFEVVRDENGTCRVVSGRRTNQTRERSALQQIFQTLNTDGSGNADHDELRAFFDEADGLIYEGDTVNASQARRDKHDKDKTARTTKRIMDKLRNMDVSGEKLIDTTEFVEFFLSHLPKKQEDKNSLLNVMMRAAIVASKNPLKCLT